MILNDTIQEKATYTISVETLGLDDLAVADAFRERVPAIAICMSRKAGVRPKGN